MSTSQHKDRRQIKKVFCYLVIFWSIRIIFCTPSPSKNMNLVFWCGLNIGIGALQDNSAHRKIRVSILGSAEVGSCPGLSKRCTFLLTNQQAGSYAPATELDLIRFWPLPFGELVWHLSTQMNNGNLDAYITVFEPRRGKCRRFIPFLFYALVYPIISSNLVNLDTLSTWFDSVRMHTCSPLSRKPLLG